MNSKLRKVIHRRNQLRNKYWKCKTEVNWEEYRKMRNLATKIRRQSEINFFKERSSVKDSKEFWKCFKPFISSKSKDHAQTITLKEEGIIITEPLEICEVFNDYYKTMVDDIGKPDNFVNPNVNSIIEAVEEYSKHTSVKIIESQNLQREAFEFKQVSTKEVLYQLKKIDVKKTIGYDNISPYFLKTAAHELAFPLMNVINACIEQNCFPDVYKRNEISPIYKAKDHFKKANYRPVGCSVAVSKIIEQLIARQVKGFFESVFHDKLSAYRQGMGCENVIVNLVEDWKKALDNGQIVCTLLMDLSKAFDSLPHRLLIAKLKAYGFSVQACQLIATYLSNRKQRVKYYGNRSDWSVITKGIPQGSVLGPIMYNIFINDLLHKIDVNFYNYADDNTISVIGENVNDVLSLLEESASMCMNWFNENMLKANPDKFQLIILDRNRQTSYKDLHIIVNETQITPVDSVRLLGIQIDVNLDFSSHVETLCKKATRNMKILLRLNVKDRKDKMMLAESFVWSCFSYCAIVWHFCNKTLSLRIEKIFERSLRFVYSDYESKFEKLLEKSNRGTMTVSRIKKIAIFMFKCLKDRQVNYLNNLAIEKSNRYNTRNCHNVNIDRFNTVKYGKNSLRYTGAKLINSIPLKYKTGDIETFINFINEWTCHDGTNCDKCNQNVWH
jgi:hypothetical protein